MTYIVQIGNSDDKLTQREWSNFIFEVYMAIGIHTKQIHFSGNSDPTASWQNACWVFEIENEEIIDKLKHALRELKYKFNQDSIAFTAGQTEFI